MAIMSDFELIVEILKDGKPKIARDVAKLARESGFDWSRENANSALYKMLRKMLVVKIETEKAPLWTLPEFASAITESIQKPNPMVISFKAKKMPLTANEDFTIRVQNIEIQFQFDPLLSPNAPYMSGDWLNEVIFVTLNPHHPYWQSFIDDDLKRGLFLTNVASEAYVQWHVAKMTSPVSPWKLLELRDKALRDIADSADLA
jgi:hypothetical protein